MPYTDPASLPGGQNIAAFLDMLAYSEGTPTVPGSDDSYNVNVGRALFHGYDKHPRIPVMTRWEWSDVAGHQILRCRAGIGDAARAACPVPSVRFVQSCPPVLETPTSPMLVDLRQFALDLQRQGGESRDRHQALINVLRPARR